MARFVENIAAETRDVDYRDTIGNVADQISSLAESLDKEISVLQGKLTPVLTMSHDDGSKLSGTPQLEGHSSLYEELQVIADKLRFTIQRVAELGHRVEL
jgi:hypothetical protein